jgi:3-phenylpropionate/cinnamic acid dioxygenase small subunit
MIDLDTLPKDELRHLLLMRKIEDFLNLEADVLDDREFERWLTFFADDLRYWMPIRKNLPLRDQARDITGDDDTAWLDDDKVTLTKRVKQILTGIHWAEEPLSRVTHLISNIRLADRPGLAPDEYLVRSHFLVHRNRLETETDYISGRREDILRRNGDSFLISSRKIIIDQTVLLAKNLTFFF